MRKEYISEVENYIKTNWNTCIRTNYKDSEPLLGLPFPYTVPCMKGTFQELYYWDTYFTNLGLIRLGFKNMARNNVDNFLYEVKKYGFIPNSNATYHLNRSQPPYLSMMVRDVYEVFRNDEWLSDAYTVLKMEYKFWMDKRSAPIGLNRYFHHTANASGVIDFFNTISKYRVKLNAETEEKMISIGENYLAEAESGWDFNPRFEGRCADFVPVDLNSNLYIYEKNFAYFSELLGTGEKEFWENAAMKRERLLNEYCWNKDIGLFVDYDFANKTQSKVESLASFFPLWAGLADEIQAGAALKNLELFEYEYGVSTCKKGNRNAVYQWDYPNGWPPLHCIVIKALGNCGFIREARRVAGKYVDVVARNYKKTGDLWEKYNVEEGSIKVNDEYEMPRMMGWTAGVFIFAKEFLEI